MTSMVPGAALLAGRFLKRLDASLNDSVDERDEGLLLLNDALWAREPSMAARRLLGPIATAMTGGGLDFVRGLKAAVADGRVRVAPSRLQAWLDDLWAGEAGDIVVERADGTLLRLSGSTGRDGRTAVRIADVTPELRREQWLESERHRLATVCEGLRRQVLALESQARSLLARAEAAEAHGAELERLAFVDPLTGLLNRRRLTELAEMELSRARRHGRSLSVLLLDLDRFKAVNDQLGHAAGDLALAQVARICRATLRSGDLVARWGGEEFVVLLPETGAGGAGQLAERLRTAIATDPAHHEGRPIPITVSIGVAELNSGDVGLDGLVGRADEALYAAKRAGRNVVLAAVANDRPHAA